MDERIVAEYKDRVFRLAISVLGPGREADAEEVTQDTFLRAVREWPRFRGESSPGTWLYRIAYNRAMDIAQSPRYRHPHGGDDQLGRLASSSQPELEADREAERRELMEAIGELPQVYQVVVRQYYWLEMGIAEIAENIDAPEGTVKSYLHRARKLLATILEEHGVRSERA